MGASCVLLVVKRSRVLADVEAEADVPYEETRLARRAVGARRRLAAILLAGALGAVLEAVLLRSVGWGLAALALGACAWGVRAGHLGGILAAALAALLAVTVPLRSMLLGELDARGWIEAVASIALGAAALPDLVTLIRDAELQHTYGVWARRG